MRTPMTDTTIPPPAGDTPPLLEIDGPRATLRLNRPSQHNRIDPADLAVLHAHLDSALAHPAVRVVVFAGSGPRTATWSRSRPPPCVRGSTASSPPDGQASHLHQLPAGTQGR